MANPAQNPLFKHFRQPAIYIRLPSHGQYWPENAIDIPHTGDIPVYPMTVKDEITLKTPDALMNGAGVVEVIQSCCPNIKDAWKAPLCDLDKILIGIRIASYGPEMDITTTCPHCKEENSNTVDLRLLIDSIQDPVYADVQCDELTFKLKPQTFDAINQSNIIQFEQTKLLDTISNSELSDEEKKQYFDQIFPRLTELNVMTVVNSIESITTSDGTAVTDQKYIKEFIDNCDRTVYTTIKDTANKYAEQTRLEELKITCSECSASYITDLRFDQANFFV